MFYRQRPARRHVGSVTSAIYVQRRLARKESATMKLKHAILETLSRDELKRICSDLEVIDIDQRSVEDMTAKLSRARRATPAVLLEYLSEAQVKDAAEKAGAPTTGRRSALIATLLERARGG